MYTINNNKINSVNTNPLYTRSKNYYVCANNCLESRTMPNDANRLNVILNRTSHIPAMGDTMMVVVTAKGAPAQCRGRNRWDKPNIYKKKKKKMDGVLHPPITVIYWFATALIRNDNTLLDNFHLKFIQNYNERYVTWDLIVWKLLELLLLLLVDMWIFWVGYWKCIWKSVVTF